MIPTPSEFGTRNFDRKIMVTKDKIFCAKQDYLAYKG